MYNIKVVLCVLPQEEEQHKNFVRDNKKINNYRYKKHEASITVKFTERVLFYEIKDYSYIVRFLTMN